MHDMPNINYTREVPLPFAPIPTDPASPMKFNPDSTYTFQQAPMPAMWQENYRAAVIWRSHEERSRYHGDLAMDLENAYLIRLRNER